MFIFETDRLGFRKWLDSDTEPFVAMCGDPIVMEYFPSTLTRDETHRFIERINEYFVEHGFGLWAIEEKKTRSFVGFTGFSKVTFESFFSPCIEIGWRLAKEFWGQGYATEAAKACLDFGFSSLGFDEIVAFTAVLNKRSERVMQKVGMHLAGYFDHPRVAEGSPLRPHVLYKIANIRG